MDADRWRRLRAELEAWLEGDEGERRASLSKLSDEARAFALAELSGADPLPPELAGLLRRVAQPEGRGEPKDRTSGRRER